jgi:hypothetical protein
VTEDEFWKQLEFRVCREFESTSDNAVGFLWCDGFMPEEYDLGDVSPHIAGWAWIGEGRTQDRWRFTLTLEIRDQRREDIAWHNLLPPEDARGWLFDDRRARAIAIAVDHTRRASGEAAAVEIADAVRGPSVSTRTLLLEVTGVFEVPSVGLVLDPPLNMPLRGFKPRHSDVTLEFPDGSTQTRLVALTPANFTLVSGGCRSTVLVSIAGVERADIPIGTRVHADEGLAKELLEDSSDLRNESPADGSD